MGTNPNKLRPVILLRLTKGFTLDLFYYLSKYNFFNSFNFYSYNEISCKLQNIFQKYILYFAHFSAWNDFFSVFDINSLSIFLIEKMLHIRIIIIKLL